MSDFIEDFYYGNIEPQECTTGLTPKLKKSLNEFAGKEEHLTTGDITIIRINTNEYLVDETDLIINYIADISSYDTVYFIGLVYDESSVANMIELDKIARRIEVPIFVGIQCIDGACKIPTKVFSVEPIPELTSEWDMLAYYFLSYSDANRKCLMAYDLFTNRFADIENPFAIEE